MGVGLARGAAPLPVLAGAAAPLPVLAGGAAPLPVLAGGAAPPLCTSTGNLLQLAGGPCKILCNPLKRFRVELVESFYVPDTSSGQKVRDALS